MRLPFHLVMGSSSDAVLLSALAFAAIYGWLVNPKSFGSGLKFGLLFGFAVGLGMGYRTYATMPVPYIMALVWFMGSVV